MHSLLWSFCKYFQKDKYFPASTVLIKRKISSIIFGCSEPVASHAANRLYSTIYTVEYTIYTQGHISSNEECNPKHGQSWIWITVFLNDVVYVQKLYIGLWKQYLKRVRRISLMHYIYVQCTCSSTKKDQNVRKKFICGTFEDGSITYILILTVTARQD